MAANLNYLDEAQNAAFDTEYHSAAELTEKIAAIARVTRDAPFSILDVGGGNGVFLDRLLESFPNATGTLVDISQGLLDKNAPNPRKRLILGSVDQLDALIGDETFDIITLNWLLHHLVNFRYDECRRNCVSMLSECRRRLKPNGRIIVAENMFNGFFGSNLPSWLIHRITTVRTGWFVALARRYFNTAGVGVCFRSHDGWRAVFADSELAVCDDRLGHNWPISTPRRLAFAALGIADVSHRHFYLRRQTARRASGPSPDPPGGSQARRLRSRRRCAGAMM